METVLSMAASQENSDTNDEERSKDSTHETEEIRPNGDYNENRQPKVIRITPLKKPVVDEAGSEKTNFSGENSGDEDEESAEEEISDDEDEYLRNENENDIDDDLEGYDDLPANASLHAADEVKKRLEEMDPCEKLRSLCKKGEAVELENFLNNKDKNGVDIDYVSSDGWTCLHEIITHGCQFTTVAKTLIQHGAKVNTTDFNQDTPLHASLLYHNEENTRLLLQYGADLNMTNAVGRKPIHNANDQESLELLIDHGADINAKDTSGNTALHYAVIAKDIDRVKLLVTRNCDINTANGSGSTPLHLATDRDIVKILLDGVPEKEISQAVNAADNAGNSPLHIAVKGRHRDTVRLLVAKNSMISLLNSTKKSPMSLAKDKEMKNILLKKFDESATPSSPGTSNASSTSSKRKPVPTKEIVLPGNPELKSPSILKPLKRKHQCINGLDERKGPRLRFSEVNDYSGVEELPPPEKRVKAVPLYTESQFSSDEDD